ncbi:exodeoxyribonuclease VII small subunit [Gorillibacterium sp. CAU 1737]|uniref:exodeoxyribonuclease VII small subunit n=1 Tax=Gorillibacterium sp. CAU 1737 TaxID=3140362 RepID=UPI003260E529
MNAQPQGENEAAALSFEEAMQRLEEIVSRLESGDVPLEQAIEWFQEGMKLSHLCGQKLEQVERKIEMLVSENGSLVKKPFAVEGDDRP